MTHGILDKLFKLRENSTTIKTEVIAGLTIFMTMAYILAVNPFILSKVGMNPSAIFTATALSAGIGTVVMAFYANLPIGVAPGMGANSFFAFTVVIAMGNSWEFALTAVLFLLSLFISPIFLAITFTSDFSYFNNCLTIYAYTYKRINLWRLFRIYSVLSYNDNDAILFQHC